MVAKKKKTSTNFYGSKIKEGTLHSALGYKQGQDIPPSSIDKVANAEIGNIVDVNGKKKKITPALKKKAVFAKNARKFNH
jgi:hypothetical protein